MFDQLLMQIVSTTTNGTAVVATDTLFGQINSLATTISTLITIVGGIIIYVITKYRQVTKSELTERDKQILEAMKIGQMNAQKGAETIGQSKDLLQTIYELNVPEEERKKLEDKIKPILKDTDERLKAANAQAEMVKAKSVQMFGPAGDIDQDPTVPRETKGISQKARSA